MKIAGPAARFLLAVGAWMLATGSPAMAQVRAPIPAEDRAQLEALTASWRGERDPTRRAALAEELRDAARKLIGQAAETESGFEAAELEKSAIYDDIAADGRLVETEIKLPKNVRDVPLTVLRSFGKLEAPPYAGEAAVIRRITRDAFELWTPRHGWLFDHKGRLLNEARPPRRDGQGRDRARETQSSRKCRAREARRSHRVGAGG